MELTELLGASFDCNCGKHHLVPTRELVYHADAFTEIPQIIGKITVGKHCLVIGDSRTFPLAGEEIAGLLKGGGLDVAHFIVPDPAGESPQADDQTRDLLLERTSTPDIYIAVGSGVINDLVKWVAHQQQKPYLVVATAASMNGYGSANVAATIDGLKVLFHATAPRAVLARPDILINAPYELSAAGLGDVLAKPVSSADWKLNQFLFQDYYCQFSVDLLQDLEPVYLDNPKNIRQRDEASFEALFQALFYSSIAMTVTGTSAPASGGEHLISHTLDILAGRDGQTHDLHGRQVGVSSILMAALYERVMDIERPEFYPVPQQVDEQFWGTLAPIVEKEYKKKLPRMAQAQEIIAQPANWDALKSLIKPHLISPRRLKDCLEQAGAAHRYSDIRMNHAPLERACFVSVVSHASQMRDRFTILDMGALLGILPGEIEGLIDDWVTR